jgi:hypothetical protein
LGLFCDEEELAMIDQDTATLVRHAAAGDELAWRQLIDGLGPLLRRVSSAYRLGEAEAEAADAVARRWLKLAENVGSLPDRSAAPGWLVTTLRRECLARAGARNLAHRMYLGVTAHKTGELHRKTLGDSSLLCVTVLSRPDRFGQAPGVFGWSDFEFMSQPLNDAGVNPKGNRSVTGLDVAFRSAPACPISKGSRLYQCRDNCDGVSVIGRHRGDCHDRTS